MSGSVLGVVIGRKGLVVFGCFSHIFGTAKASWSLLIELCPGRNAINGHVDWDFWFNNLCNDPIQVLMRDEDKRKNKSWHGSWKSGKTDVKCYDRWILWLCMTRTRDGEDNVLPQYENNEEDLQCIMPSIMSLSLKTSEMSRCEGCVHPWMIPFISMYRWSNSGNRAVSVITWLIFG